MNTVLNSLVPSVIGFAVGYVTALIVVWWTTDPATRMRRFDILRAGIGVALLVIATTVGVGSYRSIDCFRDAIAQRGQAAGTQVTAEIALWEQLLSAQGADKDFSRAQVEQYVRALHELERARAENPYSC